MGAGVADDADEAIETGIAGTISGSKDIVRAVAEGELIAVDEWRADEAKDKE